MPSEPVDATASSAAEPPVEPIVLVVETAADPATTWRHLTEPEFVADWFAEVGPLGEIGDPYRIDFGDGSVVEGLVVSHEPGATFAHGWAWQDAEPGQSTLVTWTVEPLETGGTRITLVHAGWDEAGLDDAIRDDHEAYWSGYLDDLRDVLEDAVAP